MNDQSIIKHLQDIILIFLLQLTQHGAPVHPHDFLCPPVRAHFHIGVEAIGKHLSPDRNNTTRGHCFTVKGGNCRCSPRMWLSLNRI